MNDFSADWLGLREPADARSRDTGLMQLLASWAPERSGLVILDLGCGTGANLRALAPFLGIGQRWIALDRDRALLERLPACADGPGWSARVEPRPGELRTLDWAAADLVTGSALLDLVSEAWLRRLIARHPGAAFHFALSIDGHIDLAPAHPADTVVLGAFAADMTRDKGLGPALGGRAPACAERLLGEAGYRVATATSDWKLGLEDAALAEAWLRGVAAAERVHEEVEEKTVRDWLSCRLRDLMEDKLRLRVGHRDLLALPL